MLNLRVPSLQHLSRNWQSDPLLIMRLLVQLVLHPPRLSYDIMHSAVRDMLVLGMSQEQIANGIQRGVPRKQVRDDFLEILALLSDHFQGVAPDYIQGVRKRYYLAAQKLMIPFEPPLIYGVNGQIYFTWFSFWKRNPLSS